METKSLYQSGRVFYTDPVKGKFNNIRLFTMSFSVFVFFILPWINFSNRQAFLFDIEFNRFYVFGSVFWPQDFILIALFLIFCVIALFAVTLYSGRVWCGFLCPQSTWIKISAFIARFFEGNRNNRYKLDKLSFNLYKFIIKLSKHVFLLMFSFLTAFTFIGYFIPIRSLFIALIDLNYSLYSFYVVLFFFIITYLNIWWFKEQFCFLVCPYARLQSVMFDENTLIVSYDSARGEKRGSLHKGLNRKTNGFGDCIDCKKCVTCCPTGIDIRDGLQIECISCGACVDACNSVMNKIGYKQNLISFRKESSNKNTLYSNFKLFLYLLVLSVLFLTMVYFLKVKNEIYFSISKSQYQLFNITKDNFLENEFLIKIMNKSINDATYKILAEPNIFDIIGKTEVLLKPGELVDLVLILSIRNNFYKDDFIDVTFHVLDLNSNNSIKKKSKFILFNGNFNARK